jgi:hypothetical protein
MLRAFTRAEFWIYKTLKKQRNFIETVLEDELRLQISSHNCQDYD